MPLPARVESLLPPSPLARRLSAQAVLFAVGEGVFLTGNAVFFTQVVGLTAAQVGLGFTIAGVVGFVLAVPTGRLVDRLGARRMWAASALVEALLYLVYPWIGGFAGFVTVVVALEAGNSIGHAGRGAYTLGVFSREDRVRSLAFMRSALNIGFTLGALVGGLALATGSLEVIRAVPLLTATILGLNALLIARLPDAAPGRSGDMPGEAVEEAAEHARSPGSALRNRGYVLLSVCSGTLATNQVLLNLVIPLWLVQETDAPRTLLALLFGTNTVMAVLLQVRAARGSETVPGALRAVRRCGLAFVVSCGVVLVTHDTVGWITVALIWLGHVTITGAELYQSAADWGFQSELSDPSRLGEYQGVSSLGHILGSVWAPAVYTFLAIDHGALGWVSIAAIAVAAAALSHPAARAAQSYLAAEPVPAAA